MKFEAKDLWIIRLLHCNNNVGKVESFSQSNREEPIIDDRKRVDANQRDVVFMFGICDENYSKDESDRFCKDLLAMWNGRFPAWYYLTQDQQIHNYFTLINQIDGRFYAGFHIKEKGLDWLPFQNK